MTLRMADGPVANLPAGLDAYAGYVNASGIGITWPEVSAIPAKYHLSITTDGSPAMCADVEAGAMTQWRGYTVGYAEISQIQTLIAQYGRPQKLWTAHHNNVPHICNPACGFGFTGYADGTQWTDHAGAYDESLLLGNFFDFQTHVPTPSLQGAEEMDSVVAPNGDIVSHYRTPQNHLLEVTRKAGTQGEALPTGLSILDLTAEWPQFQVAG